MMRAAPFIAALLLAAPLSTRAASPEVVDSGPVRASYALVVGSNRPGAGQQELSYAEADAERLADLLVELGRYSPEHVTLLKSPTQQRLLDAVDRIGARLSQAQAAGEQTQLLFYYSGHARAQGLSLGKEELDLMELRDRLLALPATLTIVLLDACQSGAFSAVKGAEPAAEFSFNSVQRLTTSGVAVIASSTASELSQESPDLGSSYFTHHLLMALRGAADANHDGRVALDEAYQYAYHATLAATAATALGSQHVTLEKELRGKGEVALTYPAKATTHLGLAPELEGAVVIQARSGGAIIAEIDKASGAPMVVALPPGEYTAFYRKEKIVLSCGLALSRNETTTLDVTECTEVAEMPGRRKGDDADRLPLYAIEATVGPLFNGGDSYNRRLADFGFTDKSTSSTSYGVAVSRRLAPYLSLAVRFDSFGGEERRRALATTQTFSLATFGVGLQLRAFVPLARRHLFPYVQAGGGLGIGRTVYSERATPDVVETFKGYYLACGGGLIYMPVRYFGFFGELTYVRAPVIDNLLGDVHDSGGTALLLGARAAIDLPW